MLVRIVAMMDFSTILGEASDLPHAFLDLEPLDVSIESTNNRKVAHKAGKSSSGHLKSTWKTPSDKPKRPLSAYNIFFQHEREKIITGDADATLEDVLNKIKHTPKPTKRRHRKSHGMIGFADLARSIADKWKVLHAADKAVYEAKAAIEKGKYCEQLCQWDRSREIKETGDLFSNCDVVQDDDDDDDDDYHSPLPMVVPSEKQTTMSLQHNQDSLSNLLMGGGNMNLLNQMVQTGDVQGYLSMTQRTLEMARSSLSLPLFANLPVPQRVAAISDQHVQGQFQVDRFVHNGLQAVDFSCQNYNALDSRYQADHTDVSGQFLYPHDFPSSNFT